MIEIVWEFIVKEESRGQFELVFGPGGAWSKLVDDRPGFRGTTLLRDMKNPQRFLTVELWDAEDQREQALAECEEDYAELEAALAGWTDSMAEVGVFRISAEATVRPRRRSGRRRS